MPTKVEEDVSGEGEEPNEMSLRFDFELVSMLLRCNWVSFRCHFKVTSHTSTSLRVQFRVYSDFTSISRRVRFDFALMSHRFHFAFTSNSLRPLRRHVKVTSTSIQLRSDLSHQYLFEIASTSSPLRDHADVTSSSLHIHFMFISSPTRCHFDFILVSLR